MKFPYETSVGFTIVSAKDARWTCPDKSHLTCTLVIKSVYTEQETEIPFTATADSTEDHVSEVFKHFKAKAKKYVKTVNIFELQSQFDELMIDITLGLASDEEIALARTLRQQIKEAQAA